MRYLACLLLLFCFCSAQAQKQKNVPLQKEINGRIHLREKANENLSVLPQMLLSAFCQGQIKAYFPGKPDKEMSFGDFITYFNVPFRPENDTASHTCACELCKNLDAEFVTAFSQFMDYTEIERFDNSTGKYTYQTQYLKIMLPARYTWLNKEYTGPVFRYADVEKLFPSPVFFNRQNDAARFTLRQIFSQRLYAPELRPAKDMFGRVQWEEPAPRMEQQELGEQ